jgi:putative GTP pyrophosphokinase
MSINNKEKEVKIIMILDRSSAINIPDIKEQYENLPAGLLKNSELLHIRDAIINIAELMQVYNSAMKEISTKLEILDDEFQIRYNHNPIHHLECRIKSLKSIFEKMMKRGIEPSLDAAKEEVRDIAGVRVICNFTDDIYVVEKLLLKQSDVTLITRKDYIETPKESGYRSLHIVVKIPVFLSDRTEETPVEIQLRTIAMDYWASLEHKLRYKNSGDMRKYSDMLLQCANSLAETEKTMQYIRNKIEE